MPTKFITVEIKNDKGETIATLQGTPKVFASGSKGFYVSGKFADPNSPDDRYTVSAPIVLIGSKPKK